MLADLKIFLVTIRIMQCVQVCKSQERDNSYPGERESLREPL